MVLTTQQKQTLKALALADPQAILLMDGNSDIELAAGFNGNSTKVVFKTSVSTAEVGKNFEATSLSAMTSGNNDRLVSFAMWNPQGVDPTRIDHRQFFDDVFSPASGAGTRTRLYALWRRLATRAESALATGTGTDASPALLIYEGKLSYSEASEIRVS